MPYTCDSCGEIGVNHGSRGICWCDECDALFTNDRAAFVRWEKDYQRQVFEAFAIAPEKRTSPVGVVERVEKVMGRSILCKGESPFETEHWWYVPEYSIGCSGFIVDKRDSNIKGLGSAIHIEQQFKNYDAGFRYDLIDLTIIDVFDHLNAVKFLSYHGLWHNSKSEVSPNDCPSNGPVTDACVPASNIRRWNATELSAALNDLPTTFRSQRVNARSFIDPAVELPFTYSVSRGT